MKQRTLLMFLAVRAVIASPTHGEMVADEGRKGEGWGENIHGGRERWGWERELIERSLPPHLIESGLFRFGDVADGLLRDGPVKDLHRHADLDTNKRAVRSDNGSVK